MRKWIDLINEFEKPVIDQGGLPPVADIERDDGGNSGGDYWVGPTGKVVIDKDQYGGSDHTQMVYRMPEAFGISREELMKELEPHEFNHANISRWNAAEATDSHSSEYSRRSPDSTMGGRGLAQAILFRRGWIVVSYDPPQRITIMGSKDGIKHDIQHAMDHFPMMKCDQIYVLLYDGKDMAARANTTFYKEDYPGFAGHVGALIDWVNGDHTPREGYIYLARDAKVSHGFLHIQNRGGAKAYFVPYLNEQHGRHARDRNGLQRIPSSQLPRGLKHDYSQVHGSILYSAQPFDLPTIAQMWNGRHWA